MGTYIRVAAWNLGGWQYPTPADYDFTLGEHIELINRVNPDVLLLQEMAQNAHAPRNRDWPKMIADRTGLGYYAWFGRPHAGGLEGNSIHSRYPMPAKVAFEARSTLPEPVPFVKGNTSTGQIVEATCMLFGKPVTFWSVHYPADDTNLGPPNAWYHQTKYSEAVVARIRPPGEAFVCGGDLNAEFSNPSFKPFQNAGFTLDIPHYSDYNGLMSLFHAGRNLRFLGYDRHVPRLSPSGHDLSDHMLVEARYAVEEPTEQRFRAISDWATASNGRYFGGWATMDWQFAEPVILLDFIVFKHGVVLWTDAPSTQQPAFDTRTRFTAAHDWARSRGYEHGFPNFHERGEGAGHVFGTFLVPAGTGTFRDVPVAELGLPNPPFGTPMEQWLRGAANYARRQGFIAGLPTGHAADYGSGHVCGTWLYDSSVAQAVSLRPEELNNPGLL